MLKILSTLDIVNHIYQQASSSSKREKSLQNNMLRRTKVN